jgi:dipeptidyl aminopeptidase/acylaminoacyl peptidase
MLYDRAKKTSVEALPRWDRNADGYVWAPDAKAVYVATTDAGRDKLYRATLGADGVATGAPALVIGESNNVGFSFARDAKTVVWMRDATNRPPEVYSASLDGARVTDTRQATHVNDALVSQLALNPAEDFWFKGAGGDSVQGFIVKPPQYTPARNIR